MLHLSTSGYDVRPILPTLVKLLAHPDTFIKRICSEVLCADAENHLDMAVLATNTLMQDSYDVNPVVRCLSLRTLAAIQVKLYFSKYCQLF